MTSKAYVPAPTDREVAWEPGPRTDRARKRLLEGAHEAFLSRGYGGARISDITDAAAMSRASFYVYFPSKQDALLALGAESAAAARDRLRRLRAVPAAWTDDDLRQWLGLWFEQLDRFGAFDRLWVQEAPEELKATGLAMERRHALSLGKELERLRGWSAGDPRLLGVAFSASVNGLWHHYRREPDLDGRDAVLDALVDTSKLFLGSR
ncbi:MAG: TetR/AcrR family transcriptional regulator [Acidimicrobiia bacterium]